MRYETCTKKQEPMRIAIGIPPASYTNYLIISTTLSN